jgi:hypothetical protein
MTIMKATAFWDTVPCSLVEVDRHFRGVYRLHYQGDDGSKHQRNVCQLLRDCTAQYPRRLVSPLLRLSVCVGFIVRSEPTPFWKHFLLDL